MVPTERPPDFTKTAGMCPHGNFPDSCEACRGVILERGEAKLDVTVREQVKEEVGDPDEILGQISGYWGNPRSFEYGRMIAGLEKAGRFQSFGDQYAVRWRAIIDGSTKQDQERTQALRERVSGKTVVDLGGGYSLDSRGYSPSVMQGVVEVLGARAYVNVVGFFLGMRIGRGWRRMSPKI